MAMTMSPAEFVEKLEELVEAARLDGAGSSIFGDPRPDVGELVDELVEAYEAALGV